ncbi:MAG: hypothetical protein RSD49_01525 [Hafnia sp.]
MTARKTSSNNKRFVDLTKAQRKEKLIILKNRIRQTESIFGTTSFTSRLNLMEPNRPAVCCQNFCFVMPGKHKHDIWYVDLSTASQAFWNASSGRAEELTATQFQEAGVRPYRDYEVDGVFSLTLLLESINKPNPTFAEFGGKSHREIQEANEADIILNSPPVIFEQLEVDYNDTMGIGVHIVIDEPFIDKSVVERVVQQLLAQGIQPYVAQTPVERSRLPQCTFSQQLVEDAPGYMLGWQVLDVPKLRRVF